jgi:4-hydroxy-4-methyl-2-oxoglutarate aldolase
MNRNLAAVCLLVCAAASAQGATLKRGQLLKFTKNYKAERFEDGRPKVPERLLKKMDGLSAEEVWSVLPGEGYNNQYEGNFDILHPEKKLIGRTLRPRA